MPDPEDGLPAARSKFRGLRVLLDLGKSFRCCPPGFAGSLARKDRLVAEGRAGFESQYGQPRSHQDRYLVRGYKNAQPVDPVPVFRPCLTTPSQGPLLATYACRCTKNMRAIAGRIMSGVEGAHNGIWRARPNPAMGHFSAAGLLGAKRGT